MEAEPDDRQWADNLDYLGLDQGQAAALLRHKPAISSYPGHAPSVQARRLVRQHLR